MSIFGKPLKFAVGILVTITLILVGFRGGFVISGNSYNNYTNGEYSINLENESVFDKKIDELDFNEDFNEVLKLSNISKTIYIRNLSVYFRDRVSTSKADVDKMSEPINNSFKKIGVMQIDFYKKVNENFQKTNLSFNSDLKKETNKKHINIFVNAASNTFFKLTDEQMFKNNPIISVTGIMISDFFKDYNKGELSHLNIELIDYLNNGTNKEGVETIARQAFEDDKAKVNYILIKNGKLEDLNSINEKSSMHILKLILQANNSESREESYYLILSQ